MAFVSLQRVCAPALAVFGGLLALIQAASIIACTSVLVDSGNGRLLGHNYDFHYSHGAIFISPSGLEKTGFTEPSYLPLRWTAQYASAVFSQFGRELPTAGMNEAGLTITLLWNEDAPFPSVDGTTSKVLSELQWIQYQLDLHAKVEEVIASLSDIKIRKVFADLHYVVCDASDNCSLIQYDQGELKVYKGKDFSPSVIANSTLSRSRTFYARYQGGPKARIPSSRASLNTFAKAAWLAESLQEHKTPQEINASDLFAILDEVALDYRLTDLFTLLIPGRSPTVTAWSLVFSPSERWIEFKTRENQSLRRIDISAAVRSCAEGTLSMNINSGEGDINHLLKPYNHRENKRIVRESFKPLRKEVSMSDQDALIYYPDSFKCIANE